ncbi:MAG: hypothetical protein C3F12_03135 [Candidatus Methylomirabilota bacterium]|nr:ATP-binding protein [candidate division NC10 bacterium]PWB47954.1 MAG: hypothetical protein C3F12_03135 [candidate division NC10 bacterium]
MIYRRREITQAIKEALQDMPVVVVTGLRQTGKSTLLKMESGLKGRRYINFDDFAYFAAAREDPERFVPNDQPVTIDEAQKCPEILTAIKKVVDSRRRPGQFLLSGSANFAMLKGISETLAGRAIYFTLHPFSRREITGEISIAPFIYDFFHTQEIPSSVTVTPVSSEDVLTGGMPSVCLGEVRNKDLWFKGYEQTYLERDLRDLSQIGHIVSFRHLLHLTALRSAQLLSISQLGRDAKLNVATTSRYLALLEASFVVHRIPPYLRNPASRLIRSSKVYMCDSGLACYLAGIKGPDRDLQEILRGPMLETYVAQNLSAIMATKWPEASLCFWSIQGRYEVDFIVEAGTRCLAIEVKGATRWDDKDLSGLRAFIAATPQCVAGILAYNGEQAVRLGEKLWAIPLGTILS